MRFLRDSRDPWKAHGYAFALSYGVYSVCLGAILIKLLGVPFAAPVNQSLTPRGQLVFLFLVIVSAGFAYLLARLTSYAAHVLLEGLWRKRN